MSNPFTQDGHKVVFGLNKDAVSIVRVECPHDSGAKGVCNANRSYCVVRRFINIFGTDFCVGSAVIGGPVEIAWMAAFGDSDIDPSVGAIYFTPVDDLEYQEMLDEDLFSVPQLAPAANV